MRFSALGDVAMTLPVVKEFLQQHPDCQLVFLSRDRFKPLFEDIPNLTFHGVDLKKQYKGVIGLFLLAIQLKGYNFDAVADLHNVLRTKIIRKFLRLFIGQFSMLDKARKDRKRLLAHQIHEPLKPMTERYADVFRKLGFALELSHQLPENPTEKEHAVGIAPFAMYPGKMYPLQQMQSVALKLAENGIKVYLFGSKDENIQLKEWTKLSKNIFSVAGKYDLKQEIELIQKLKIMISMDSANMHLASVAGTRCISIWGNTHPFMGFLGYGQSMQDVIQDESMEERPTSVYGKEPKNAPPRDFFKNISPEFIVEKVLAAL